MHCWMGSVHPTNVVHLTPWCAEGLAKPSHHQASQHSLRLSVHQGFNQLLGGRERGWGAGELPLAQRSRAGSPAWQTARWQLARWQAQTATRLVPLGAVP